MKVKKSLVIVRPDDSLKLIVIGEEGVATFQETTPVETLLKTYAYIYRMICDDLYSDETFTCHFCDINFSMTRFSGVVMDVGKLLATCDNCAAAGDDSEVDNGKSN